uniref:Septin-type G domain-containing protein n=1 Tax=Varanus komodoensis TaxID=61221 RepID=A0A8D2J6Y5_VARKO
MQCPLLRREWVGGYPSGSERSGCTTYSPLRCLLMSSFSVSQDKDYVGFATLPSQVHRKSVKKGFDFTLLVAGESGLGKSTLVNSLFLTDLYKDRELPDMICFCF